MSETEVLFAQLKLQHIQNISRTISNHKMRTNNLAKARPLTYIHRSDSLISLTPSQLLIRRKLSINPPITGAIFTLESSAPQKDLYKIDWSRRESEILKALTPGSKWGTLHPTLHKGSTCLLTSSKGDSRYSGDQLNYRNSINIVPSMINIIKKVFVDILHRFYTGYLTCLNRRFFA